MSAFTWSDRYSVGSDVLDADHKQLMAYINQIQDLHLAHLESDNVEPETVSALLRSLWEYTVSHFEREEEYMALNKYPHLKTHKNTHEDLRKSLRDMTQKFELESFSALPGILVFLSSWWLSHITRTDSDYAQYIQGSPALKSGKLPSTPKNPPTVNP